MAAVVSYTFLINVALNYDLILLRRFAGMAVDATRAGALAGNYEALRNLALLPYQALLVVTFVIFPLVSRSTFAEDRETTRAYVRQTLRYAMMLAAAMGVVLAARPLALLSTFYPPAYSEGARALPVLVSGICCLALLAVSGSIVNASGHPKVAVGLVATTVIVGGALAFVLVPAAEPGPEMLFRAAVATSLGMLAGLAVALVYLRKRFEAGPPLASVGRTLVATVLATIVGRLIPGTGKLMGLASLGIVGVTYLAALIVMREFGPEDRAKMRKILRR
jgi:O-antigen/teichoic acid export membrane protein